MSGLSRSVWGVKTLSERCVRKQSNTQTNELSPKKKAAVGNFFEIWMRDKRKYPEDLISDELKKLNKYLNGAITSARNTIAPKKRIIHAKDNSTLLHYPNHSENEVDIGKENNSRKTGKKNIDKTFGEQTKNFTSVAIDEQKRSVINVSKEDLNYMNEEYDKNINNPDPLMDNDNSGSNEEDFSETE